LTAPADGNSRLHEFESARLLIRALAESDQELYCELFSNAETMRYIGPPWTRTEAARAFRLALSAARCDPPQGLFLTLIERAAQRPVGLCTLQNFEWPLRRVELGLMLAPAGRAQGFATEALVAVVGRVFAILALDEIWVRFAVDHALAEHTALSGGLVRHPQASPADIAANLWRWSAYRASWQPARAAMRHQT
jgi:RimJ/RimL family protein N-acetyltransferase